MANNVVALIMMAENYDIIAESLAGGLDAFGDLRLRHYKKILERPDLLNCCTHHRLPKMR